MEFWKHLWLPSKYINKVLTLVYIDYYFPKRLYSFFLLIKKVADGKSTKILIPSEIQNLAGFMQAIKEIK